MEIPAILLMFFVIVSISWSIPIGIATTLVLVVGGVMFLGGMGHFDYKVKKQEEVNKAFERIK